ncbi:DM13 domain-containing protein [Nocardia arizonensis]|uniref:DM13 domain-containing protein n=1 Tax=Nocardia arizonensis TaxID=1141647 RepID=UPI0006D06D22|nr:DM13 domain-containing protein [Nocardia arizonensis]
MVSSSRVFRSPIIWIAVTALAVGFGVALVAFQPWKLFTDTTVDDAAPTVISSPGGDPVVPPLPTSRGEFVSHEHHTVGAVVVLRLADGSSVLRLEELDTSDGPDVHVWLTDQPVTDSWTNLDDGEHVDLGKMKGNKGNQNYPVPGDVDMTRFGTVSLWCERFHVSFGAAALRPI